MILYKDLQKLDEAVGHVKSATTNQKLIIWDKREIKMVTIDESSPEERSVRVAMTTSRPTNGIETRISTLEEQQKEHTRFLNEQQQKISLLILKGSSIYLSSTI